MINRFLERLAPYPPEVIDSPGGGVFELVSYGGFYFNGAFTINRHASCFEVDTPWGVMVLSR